MKYLRLGLGLLVALGALWIILGEQLAGASADAVLNAQVVTVRSPVAGTLAFRDRAPGTRVAIGEELAVVQDGRVDSVRRDDLVQDRALAEAERDRLAATVAGIEAERDRLLARSTAWQERRVAELEIRLTRARERVALLSGGAGVGPIADADEAAPGSPRTPAGRDPAELALSHAEERVAVLENDLAAAQEGLFLGDGYNDAPFSGQRALQLEGEIARLRAELGAAEARLAATIERLGAETLRTGREGLANLRAPVDGIFWEELAASGTEVQRGDPVATLLDCSTTLVTLSVTRNIYNDLAPGMAASFRLDGDGRAYPATVARLAGAGAATVYRSLAIAPGPRHLERYDVALMVPDLLRDPDLACAVGRTGRAFFDRRPLDALRSLF